VQAVGKENIGRNCLMNGLSAFAKLVQLEQFLAEGKFDLNLGSFGCSLSLALSRLQFRSL